MQWLLVICLLFINLAFADDWEDFCKDGYGVIFKSKIEDDFNGCDYDKPYPVVGGYVFVCREYNYSYSYRPDFFVLKNVSSNSLKYIIDDEEYEGSLFKK